MNAFVSVLVLRVFQRGIAKIVVDDKALEKIEGSTIDFTEDLIGSKYVV